MLRKSLGPDFEILKFQSDIIFSLTQTDKRELTKKQTPTISTVGSTNENCCCKPIVARELRSVDSYTHRCKPNVVREFRTTAANQCSDPGVVELPVPTM